MSDLVKTLPAAPDVLAPDGLEVRVLMFGEKGSMCHFHLPPGKTGRAVVHKTVEEIWYFTEGAGEMWLSSEGVLPVATGTALRIPVGTQFQARAGGLGLTAVAITMPPWPGDDEAVVVAGHWDVDL
ncbi:hypothetical protein AIOL_001278 [Candidatus Rhodobacter oscarellae]|uniref:Cupin 2 conserved barrel domain-containing protein n=1 Tax=Candidatus Rhodobacter oscarellae TaxID=1675527 RepID=A0A0J9E058_9RHOB|nr:cupin [Candidatus Rhodobacter lobularis]KMW56326.1 hypothetical protein AIOL_001278 [Candidatus Rhodobacter lobularis]